MKSGRNQNGQNWEPNTNASEADTWDNGGYQTCPPARNEGSWNNGYRNVPPWQQQHQQQQQRNHNFWQDSNAQEMVQQAPWNTDFKEQYQRNAYADFNRVGGPVRKNLKFNNYRTRPY